MIKTILRKITTIVNLRTTALSPLLESPHIGGTFGGTF